MLMNAREYSLFTTEVIIKPAALRDFTGWQARFNEKVSSQKGFISLEILNDETAWFLFRDFTQKAT